MTIRHGLEMELYDALQQARLQLEYLDTKYPATGTTAAVLALIREVLAKAEGR